MSKRVSKRARRAVETEVRTLADMFAEAVLDHPLVQRDAHLKFRAEHVAARMEELAQVIVRRGKALEAKK